MTSGPSGQECSEGQQNGALVQKCWYTPTMDVLSTGPLRVGHLLWTSTVGSAMLTVVAKGTFELTPDVCVLASDQEPPNDDDNHWDDNPSLSVYSPCDLMPFKSRVDVVLVGSAYAPNPPGWARSLVARLQVGRLDKAIEVLGDRHGGGSSHDAEPFERMSLRYERAAGGPGTSNPVGIGPGEAGRGLLPNLRPFSTRSLDGAALPVGFGPVATTWPQRQEKLGRLRDGWPTRDWPARPLPNEVDPGYFNVAPPDQQLAELRDDERIVLENLHPRYASLQTSLPNIRPYASLERSGQTLETHPMRADTLWIDTDRGLCTLVWRGQIPLQGASDWPRVVIALGAGAGRRSAAAAYPRDGSETESAPLERPTATMPFRHASVATALSGAQAHARARASVTVEANEERNESARTVFLEPSEPPPPSLPFERAATPLWHPDNALPPAPPKLPDVGREPQPLARPLGPLVEDSPWAMGGARQGVAAYEEAPAVPVQVAPPKPLPLSSGGALAASNAAAAESQESPPQPPPGVVVRSQANKSPREPVRLVWCASSVAPRLQQQPAWRKIILASNLGAEQSDGSAPEEEAADEKDRRHVREVLACAEVADGAALRSAYQGHEKPTLVVLGGSLSFPFDETETLKATVTCVTPFAGPDKRLAELLELARALLSAPSAEAAGPVAEALTEKLEEAFAQSQRQLPADYLRTQTEGMLLRKRSYQKRTLYGQEQIRTLFVSDGGSDELPAYLPEEVGKQLPMAKRFACRVLAEVDPKQDFSEACALALRVLAVGRRMVAVG